jgi:rhodanese-related sulfurtransferase
METQDDRLFRLSWQDAVVRSDGGAPLLPVPFVVESGRRIRVIDLRDPGELVGPTGHVPGAVSVPFHRVASLLESPPEMPLVLVCEDGRRSSNAARALDALGRGWVAAMRGGMRTWRDLGYGVSRNPRIYDRTLETTDSASADAPALEAVDVERHLGDPGRLQWVKVAALLLHGRTACVDGRDDHGVVGTPGGDAGEFLLALGAIEAVGGPIDPAKVAPLLRSWVDTFGSFYLHSDVAALNRLILALRAHGGIPESALPLRTDPPSAWRAWFGNPPQEYRSVLLDLLVSPDHLGCGHLRLTLTTGSQYGVREELVRAFLRAFFELRWEGWLELGFVPLGGGHQEGAVLRVFVEGELWPFTKIPLISPNVGGRQAFVVHPQVTAYQRRQVAAYLQGSPILPHLSGRADALSEAMAVLGGKQASLTLSRLAAGLPIFDVTFSRGPVRVDLAGHVAGPSEL